MRRSSIPGLVPSGVAGLLVLAGLLAGCSDNSITDPGRPSLEFSGNLVAEGRSSHTFEPANPGTVAITLIDLTAELVDVSGLFDPDNAFVGLGIGRPGEDGCTITGQTSLGEGDRQLYGLEARDYCITLFDPGNFPDEATFSYVLNVQLPD